MKVKKIKNIFEKDPAKKFSNEWKTSKYMFKQPCLHLISGCRGSGKSHTVAKYIRSGNAEKLWDRVFFITPSYLSNKKQFDDLNVDEVDVFLPERDAIQQVIEQVEMERDDWETYQAELNLYNKMKGTTNDFTEEEMGLMTDLIIDNQIIKPTWKRDIIRKPQCLLVLDDILSTPAITQGSNINKLFMTNRHIGQLQEGGSLGLSVIMLVQTYSTTNGHGIGRALRENLTELTVFSNKQEKQVDKMVDEMGGSIDPDKFREAYKYAIQNPHDNLSVSFTPKCKTMMFRRNLNEMLIFDEDLKECKCKKS